MTLGLLYQSTRGQMPRNPSSSCHSDWNVIASKVTFLYSLLIQGKVEYRATFYWKANGDSTITGHILVNRASLWPRQKCHLFAHSNIFKHCICNRIENTGLPMIRNSKKATIYRNIYLKIHPWIIYQIIGCIDKPKRKQTFRICSFDKIRQFM